MNTAEKMRIVIVGAGFGGVRAALKLANNKNIRVRLIAPQSYFEYHAALYRAATGRSPLEVAIPLVDFFEYADNVEVVEDTVTSVDTRNYKAQGASGTVYAFDRLILAFGDSTNYYDIPGLKEHSFGVKSIHEALRFKRHLHQQLMDSDIEQSYVVVGGGATGVELAAEMVSYLKYVRSVHNVASGFDVYLVEAKDRVLNKMPEDYSQRVEQRLQRLGVKLICGTTVKAETKDSLELEGKSIPTHTVVWTAGVKNNTLAYSVSNVNHGTLGRIKVDSYLKAAEGVYVIGDAVDTTYSGMAQSALHHADYVASSIIREAADLEIDEFTPKKPIYAIPVGSRWSAVLWGRLKVYGRFGWFLRRLADLRLYLNFLPTRKAISTWRYGFEKQEVCPVCTKK